MAQQVPEQLPFEMPYDEAIEGSATLFDLLDTQEKLRVLHDDIRAGFVPATHREKNQAVAVLDYLDNPDYRGGVHDYLAEIYAHTKKVKKSSLAGSLAVRSVLYEFSDYAGGARNDAQALVKLKICLDDTLNPHTTLADVAEDHQGAQLRPAVFIRDRDVVNLARGQFRGLHDPLTTQEYRRQARQGKNKVVIDAYTTESLSPYMIRYLDEQQEALHAGESRPAVVRAMEAQQRRFTFWSGVLQGRMYEYQHYADDALRLLGK